MRLAFTVGITNANQAVLLRDHNSPLVEHKRGAQETAGEFKEILILETSSSTKRKRMSTGGEVNGISSLPVALQKDKTLRSAAENPPESRGKSEGHVNLDSAKTIAEQEGRAPAAPRAPRRSRKTSATNTAVPEKKNAAAKKTSAADSGKPGDEGLFSGPST